MARPRLTLLRGGALNVREPLSPKQLELPLANAASGLLVVHSYLLIDDFATFCGLIDNFGIRQVVDIRVSPSFADRGFSRARVEAYIRDRGGEYRWARELINPFVGESWNELVTLERYRAHVERMRAELRRELDPSRSNILLFGDHRAYQPSECSVLIDTLMSESPPVKLVIDPHP